MTNWGHSKWKWTTKEWVMKHPRIHLSSKQFLPTSSKQPESLWISNFSPSKSWKNKIKGIGPKEGWVIGFDTKPKEEEEEFFSSFFFFFQYFDNSGTTLGSLTIFRSTFNIRSLPEMLLLQMLSQKRKRKKFHIKLNFLHTFSGKGEVQTCSSSQKQTSLWLFYAKRHTRWLPLGFCKTLSNLPLPCEPTRFLKL